MKSKVLTPTMVAALNDLVRDLKRLKPEQGPQARRNAREVVLSRLRGLRKLVDVEFPGERRVGKRTKRLKLTPEKRAATKGLLEVGVARERELLQAGVKVTPVQVSPTVWKKYAPTWAVNAPAGTPLEMFRKARRSQVARAALVSAARCAAPAKVSLSEVYGGPSS